MICKKCNLEMKKEKTTFLYLGHEMYHDILRCPKCGLVYLPEELVTGKMADVEKKLEEK